MNFIYEIWKFKQVCSNQDHEIKYIIIKKQIYDKCIALGQKLILLIAKFNLIHIVVTL